MNAIPVPGNKSLLHALSMCTGICSGDADGKYLCESCTQLPTEAEPAGSVLKTYSLWDKANFGSDPNRFGEQESKRASC